MKQRHTFPSIGAAINYLRGEGFKPDTEKPRDWHRIQDHEKETAHFIHVSPNGGPSKVEITKAS